ncbi:MAG: aminoacyl-tRNA hydrolase [Candidatus Dormibacteraeota bacterium]|nr:aminoacyl-tRNA hydrolase [Candidatus Dormibacteraeota bacterium]
MGREELLIVGLGNPESEYADTRHNLGFACVHELARRLGVQVDRKRWQSLVGHSDARGIWLLLPQTYMNLSGQPVAKALRDLSLTPRRTWVVHDELDLPLCRMRIRLGGSGAGHKGVLSLISSLGTADFVRFRVGIGKPARTGSPSGRHYVLGRFTKGEAARLPNIVDGVASALELAIEAGIERAMEQFNRPGALGCTEVPRGGVPGSGSAGPAVLRGGVPPRGGAPGSGSAGPAAPRGGVPPFE